jgi:hypothetical protein
MRFAQGAFLPIALLHALLCALTFEIPRESNACVVLSLALPLLPPSACFNKRTFTQAGRHGGDCQVSTEIARFSGPHASQGMRTHSATCASAQRVWTCGIHSNFNPRPNRIHRPLGQPPQRRRPSQGVTQKVLKHRMAQRRQRPEPVLVCSLLPRINFLTPAFPVARLQMSCQNKILSFWRLWATQLSRYETACTKKQALHAYAGEGVQKYACTAWR